MRGEELVRGGRLVWEKGLEEELVREEEEGLMRGLGAEGRM